MSRTDPHRILVVDDEAYNISALYRILSPMYDVIAAKSGQSAIQKAVKHMPDLILLDIILPDISGFDVFAALKDSEVTSHIPIVFITGLDSSEDEERGLMLGAVDYIVKPFRKSVVKARVHTHLQIVEYINRVDHMCKVDALTDIANRRYFDSQLVIEWDRAARNNKHLGILMIDIDNFKNYNDTYGHTQGDILLKTLAETLRGSLLRSGDFIARWGGEEFAVILPDAGPESVLTVAERIRANVENMVIPCGDGRLTSITVSVGANSEIAAAHTDVQDFIDLADKALYEAKSLGKNRISMAPPHGDPPQ